MKKYNLKYNQYFSGMTVIEVLVAIGIFAIGMLAFVALFANAWKNNSFIIEEGRASLIASRSVEQLVKNIRKASQSDSGEYPILSGDDFDLILFFDIDNDNVVERVHYYLDQDEDQLIVGTADPSGVPVTYPSEDEETSILANYIVNENDEPLFYYFNEDYPGDLDNNPLTTPIVPNETKLIGIHVLANPDPDNTPEYINIESIVELRNLDDYTE